MKKTLSITPEGKLELEKELAALKARRPEITERIATARSYGDLSENEDYSAARSDQKVVETRILDIENILKNSTILRAGKRTQVALGATVELSIGAKTATYRLVSPLEANPLEGKISDASPIGRDLLHKKVGDTGKLPSGKPYKITSIQ
jgi:transcription elongation factor GreA